MPLDDNSFPCFWLTIGIGNDTRVESMFKKIYPQCKIFGIDSNPEQFGDFDAYGTPLPFAVGVNEDVLPLVILEKKGYVFHKEVKVMPMNIILKDWNIKY
uniref:Uncharacterized protein n=1 Tax=Acrobeloides nanus TaxID=290746 RepID=A0A914CIY4_9BILA